MCKWEGMRPRGYGLLSLRPADMLQQENDCQSLSGFGVRILQRNDVTCGVKVAEEMIQWRLR
jgi:hypothetical protein